MTVTNLLARWEYTGDNVTKIFAYTNKIFATGDLRVFLDEVQQVSGFAVNGVGQTTGGNVTFTAAPGSGVKVLILSEITKDQQTDYVEGDPFPAASHEDALDKLTLLVTQLSDKVDRCVKWPATEAVVPTSELPAKAARLSQLLGFGPTLAELVAVTPLAPGALLVSSYIETLLDDANAAAARTTLDAQQDLDNVGTPAAGQVLTYPIGWTADKFGANALINGDFQIDQRRPGLAYDSNDDTYTLDRWVVLAISTNYDLLQTLTNAPAGSRAALQVNAQFAASGKVGLLQIIEKKNCAHLFGQTVSLSFTARTENSEFANLRAHVLAWDGAADVVTSDVVNVWGGVGVNPTFVANWTAENVAANLALTNSDQRFKIEGVSIDTANAENLAIFIHTDDDGAAVDDTFFITDIKLELGAIATPFVPRPVVEELQLCQRHYWKSFDQTVQPGTTTEVGARRANAGGTASGQTDAAVNIAFDLPVNMFGVPTVTVYGTTGVTGNLRKLTATAGNVTAIVEGASETGFVVRNSAAGINNHVYACQAIAEKEL